MGQLISRLFKRFGSSTNQQNNSANNEQQRLAEEHSADSQDSCPRQRVQSIPVGQSIDSAEYTALARANEIKGQILEDVEPIGDNGHQGDKRVGVEEAVIKIQALFRGHLTRKALKDTQQFNNLGQSHFDHETLMRSPAAPVFELPNSQAAAATSTHQVSSKPHLDSIEELSGDNNNKQQRAQLEEPTNDTCSLRASSPGNRDRLRKLTLQPSSGTLDLPSPGSPGPSESGASIDLGGECNVLTGGSQTAGSQCESPASASVSIDILDHNIRPTEQMASVLHHKTTPNLTQQTNEEQDELERQENDDEFDVDNQCIINNNGRYSSTLNGQQSPPMSADCREQAAIRIQSAFRGYKTRKSSPYRKRSPSTSNNQQQQILSANEQLSNGFNGENNHQSNEIDTESRSRADLANEDDHDDDDLINADSSEILGRRRESRTRERLSFENNDNSTTISNAQPNQSQPQLREDSKSLQGEDSTNQELQRQLPSNVNQAIDAQSLGSTDVLTVISAGKPAELSSCVKKDLSEEHEQLRQLMESQKSDSLDDLDDDRDQQDSLANDLSACEPFDSDLTAALEQIPSSATTDQSRDDDDVKTIELTTTTLTTDIGSDTKAAAEAALTCDPALRRVSDLSQDDIITDSSLLGAALSFNESSQHEEDKTTPTPDQESLQVAEMDAEAERLVGELEASSINEALNELSREEGEEEVVLDEERTVDELESDDIERRDPSGQLVATNSIKKRQQIDEQTTNESQSNSNNSSTDPQNANEQTSTRSSSIASSKSDKENSKHEQEQQAEADADAEADQVIKEDQPKGKQQKQEQFQQRPHRTKSKNRKRKGAKK